MVKAILFLILSLKENYKNDYSIGKYGHLRLEYLKNTNPLKWTGLMNNYKLCAEEIILKELIYC